MKPSGAHTHPEMGGGGISAGGVLLVIAAAVVYVNRHALEKAAGEFAMGLLISALAAAALAITAVVAVAVWRRRHPRELYHPTAIPPAQGYQLPRQEAPPVIENHWHNHFYGMTPEEVAAAIERRKEQP
jgi:hypothetical protein